MVVGAAYHFGGVPGGAKDLSKAVGWYRRAAENGEPQAQAMLATLYQRGEGVAQSDAEAAKWFEKAALQGLPIAQAELSRMYAEGIGVNKDDAKAAYWQQKAAESDDPFVRTIPPEVDQEAEDMKATVNGLKMLRSLGDRGVEPAGNVLDRLREASTFLCKQAPGVRREMLKDRPQLEEAIRELCPE